MEQDVSNKKLFHWFQELQYIYMECNNPINPLDINTLRPKPNNRRFAGNSFELIFLLYCDSNLMEMLKDVYVGLIYSMPTLVGKLAWRLTDGKWLFDPIRRSSLIILKTSLSLDGQNESLVIPTFEEKSMI